MTGRDASEIPLEIHLGDGTREFFDQVVRQAMARSDLSTSADCERYLVELLVDFGRPGAALQRLDKPFGVAFLEASNASGPARFDRLRVIGDTALYHTSFFRDHFRRRGVALGFVAGLGAAAYDRASALLSGLSHEGHDFDVFGELASKFDRFVQLLTQVSDTLYANGARTSEETVNLYRRWLETASPALREALIQRGWGNLGNSISN